MAVHKIAVFTGTRAEYGLLYWLLKDIQSESDLSLQLIVSGAHLSPEFGLTEESIVADGFEIAAKVEMLLSSDSAVGTVKSLGLGIIGYADALERLKPDLLVILGDRYEALGAAQSAMLMRIPVLHIHGGEITEGAYDDAIRHAITKLSVLHATSTEEYKQRVIQLGEDPRRVWNVGAVGLDHLNRMDFMSKEALSESLNFELGDEFAIVTYHPVTLANEPAQQTFENLITALDGNPHMKVILTYPNADEGGRKIIPLIEQYAEANRERVLAIPSLGQRRYLSAVKLTSMVIGNSSSGIIEVPSFHVPTVNIGERQKGRLSAKSVIHCGPKASEIEAAITRAREITHSIKDIVNPYGDGKASGQIINMIKTADFTTIKTFYDIGR
ncbi:UDP-N-acetylglucosamine 2-epimerase [Aliidiomarina sp. Khilg15.8]